MFKKIFKSKKDKKLQIIQKELEENSSVLKSLKEYDEGKKEISTTELERRLPNLPVTG